jgi:excisionase family DNA binding protein
MDKLLTVAELAERMGLTPTTIYRWLSAGRLTCIRLSPRCLRFREREIEEMLNRITHKAKEDDE